MDNALNNIVDIMRVERTNIVTNIDEKYQEKLIELFLGKISRHSIKYKAITIDAFDLMVGLNNIRRIFIDNWNTDEFHVTDIKKTMQFSNCVKDSVIKYYKRLYEEYLTISILLQMDCGDKDLELYKARKKVIEKGSFDEMIESVPICASTLFIKGRMTMNVRKFIFLKNAQFVNDRILQEAIYNFVYLNTSLFKFTILTEVDTVLPRKETYDSRYVQIIPMEYEKCLKKTTI